MPDLMLRAYKASITMEPVALLDYYVKVKTYKSEYYRQVDYFESIPPFQALDLGALAAQIVSARLSMAAGAAFSNFDLQNDEFAQWRWFPFDNFMARLFLPAGVAKYQLKFLQLGVEKSIIFRDPTLVSTEFFSWEDERPAFEAMNFSDYALNATRIIAMGYRFHTALIGKNQVERDALIEKIKAGTVPCTTILAAGLAG